MYEVVLIGNPFIIDITNPEFISKIRQFVADGNDNLYGTLFDEFVITKSDWGMTNPSSIARWQSVMVEWPKKKMTRIFKLTPEAYDDFFQSKERLTELMASP